MSVEDDRSPPRFPFDRGVRDATAHHVAEAAARANGDGPRRHRRAEKGLGYLTGLFRTRRGPRFRSSGAVLSSSAAEGALAGHTAHGQPTDPGAKADSAAGVARLRAAHAANERLETMRADARLLKSLRSKLRESTEELRRLTKRVRRLEQLVAQLMQELAHIAARQDPPAPTPVPDEDEWEEIADEAIPGYRIKTGTRVFMFSSAALIEGLFTGTYVSGVASIGVGWLSIDINLALPWFAGAAIGALIPAVAERAAHAAATAEDDAPWYVRYVVEITIAVPAALGLGRAADMAQDDLISGLLGVAIALLLTALAILTATIGYREALGAERDHRRTARARLRAEQLKSRKPGPTQAVVELDAKGQELARANEQLASVRAQRDALRTEREELSSNSSEIESRLRALVVASRLDAERESGLAVAACAAYRQRRDAVAAAHGDWRPEAFDANAWPEDVENLPQVRWEDVMAELGEPGGADDEEDRT